MVILMEIFLLQGRLLGLVVLVFFAGHGAGDDGDAKRINGNFRHSAAIVLHRQNPDMLAELHRRAIRLAPDAAHGERSGSQQMRLAWVIR